MPGASLQEIKQAYRSLARSAHPDLNRGQGNEFMARLNRAYQTLTSRFQSQAAPYEFQDFGFYRAARPGPEPPGTQPDPPTPEPEPAKTEPGNTVFGPGGMPLAAGPLPVRLRPGPLDAPLPERGRAESPKGFTATAPQPRQGCQLTGLDRKQGSLVYRLEVTGSPQKAVLPVRTLHVCTQCGGGGLRLFGGSGLCPGCGGAGRIAKPKNMEVKLPPEWADGHLMEAETSTGQRVLLELRRSPARGEA